LINSNDPRSRDRLIRVILLMTLIFIGAVIGSYFIYYLEISRVSKETASSVATTYATSIISPTEIYSRTLTNESIATEKLHYKIENNYVEVYNTFYYVKIDTSRGLVNEIRIRKGLNLNVVRSFLASELNANVGGGCYVLCKNVSFNIISSSQDHLFITVHGYIANFLEVTYYYSFYRDSPAFLVYIERKFLYTGPAIQDDIYFYANTREGYKIFVVNPPSGLPLITTWRYYDFPIINASRIPWIWIGNSTDLPAEGIGVAVLYYEYGPSIPTKDTFNYFVHASAGECGFNLEGSESPLKSTPYAIKDEVNKILFLVWANIGTYEDFSNYLNKIVYKTYLERIAIEGSLRKVFINLLGGVLVSLTSSITFVPSSFDGGRTYDLFIFGGPFNGTMQHNFRAYLAIEMNNSIYKIYDKPHYTARIIENNNSSAIVESLYTWKDKEIKLRLLIGADARTDKIRINGTLSLASDINISKVYLVLEAYKYDQLGKSIIWPAIKTQYLPRYIMFNSSDGSYGWAIIFPKNHGIKYLEISEGDRKDRFEVRLLLIDLKKESSETSSTKTANFSFELKAFSPVNSFTLGDINIVERTHLRIWFRHILDNSSILSFDRFYPILTIISVPSKEILANITFAYEYKGFLRALSTSTITSDMYILYPNGTRISAQKLYDQEGILNIPVNNEPWIALIKDLNTKGS